MTPREVADGLAREPIWDGTGRLKAGGRAELHKAIDRVDGGRVYVAVLPGANLREFHGVWELLSLNPEHDLLLLYDGQRWEARGFGLDDAQIARALDDAEPALREYDSKGLVAAIDGLHALSLPPSTGIGWPLIGALGFTGVAVTATIGAVIARRMARQQENILVDTLRKRAEDEVADLLLSADALPRDEALGLQEKATRLSRELRRAVESDDALPVRTGRIRQVENEVVALKSTVLQRTKSSQ